MSILKENITFETNSPIWGIKYNDPHIALEVRNQDEETVKYIILDKSLNLLNTIIPKENWLINLEILTNNELILSTFEEGETPSKKDILIYDINSSKEELIENQSLIEISNTELILKDHESDEVVHRTISNVSDVKITFPAHYSEESEHLITVSDFLRTTALKEKVVSADYLETKDHIIISYFCLENDMLNSYLLITDTEGSPVHQFKTGEKLNGIAFDTFFLVKSRLYYIANQNSLSTLSL